MHQQSSCEGEYTQKIRKASEIEKYAFEGRKSESDKEIDVRIRVGTARLRGIREKEYLFDMDSSMDCLL